MIAPPERLGADVLAPKDDRRPQRRRRMARVWLALPAVGLTIVFFVIPLLFMSRISLTEHIPGSAYVSGTWTWEGYRSYLTDTRYLKTFGYTLWVSLLATVICLALAYPLAYWITKARPWLKVLLLFAVVVPLWTNLVVLIYGWLIILSPGGILNGWIMGAGLRDTPIRAVYNTTGVVVGLVQITMPYAILIMTAVLAGIDRSLVEAARNLGASRVRSFLRVTLPLSVSGIAAAATVVFVWAMGEYATPALLGSSRTPFVSQEVAGQMLQAFNWSRGAALAISLFILIIVVLIAAQGAGHMMARRRAR
jgi:ABC-type spermidine/putrescine transport system permease subunit I